jgi:hypothetical protein
MSAWVLRYHVPRSQVYEGSRGGQSGAVHLHATEAVDLGRIKRQPGQVLCGRRGWYERPVEHESDLRVRCGECLLRAKRYGIAWPDESESAGHRRPA